MIITLPERLRASLERKRLLFTVTPGRSGTGYLAKLLSFVPGVASFHEPEPRFSEIMRSIQQDADIAYEFWVKKKLPRIASERVPIYVETSHLFCKGFIEPLLKLGITPDLIILTRPHRQVAISMYQLNTIPGRTEKGLKYYLSPRDSGVLPLPEWQSLHDYQLCYWYCLEIERRSHRYERMFLERNARVVKIALDEVSTAPGFNRLLQQLDLPKPGIVAQLRLFLARHRRINTKARKKTVMDIPENIDSLEQEVLDIVRETKLLPLP